MKSFKSFLSESFVNAVNDKNYDKKEKYVQQVWDILQQSYKSIGGIFNSSLSRPKSY